MKIYDLKDKVLKCISNCTGFAVDEPEAVPIFVGKFIQVIDVTSTHILAVGIPFYGKFKINKNRLN